MDFNNIQADYFDVKNGVISFTSVLIYAPLVLLVLYIIYLFIPLLISGITRGAEYNRNIKNNNEKNSTSILSCIQTNNIYIEKDNRRHSLFIWRCLVW